MTPQSVSVALAATLLTGLFGGWLFRERATGRHWSFAVAVTVGLLLFRTPNAAELLAKLKPVSALDWVIWIAIAVAVVQSIPGRRLRTSCAFALGFAAPLRLIWGSVYLKERLPDATVLTAIIVWALAIGFAISINRPAAQKRFSFSVAGWVLLVASSICVIAATGSITYAVAMGVVGIAILGNLLGASRLPLDGAAIMICITGLSLAFSETPLPSGVLLVAGTLVVSYTSQAEAATTAWRKPLQIAAHMAIVCVAAFTLSRAIAPSDQYGGYESNNRFAAEDLESVEQTSLTDSVSVQPQDGATDQDTMPDPFAGFEP